MSTKSKFWEKYKDPRWQKRRLEILSLNDFHCQNCGDGASTLNVHHVLYRKKADPWEYEDHELQCLCEGCHASAEDQRSELLSEIAQTWPPAEAMCRIIKILRRLKKDPDGIEKLQAWFACAYFDDLLGTSYHKMNSEFPFMKESVELGEMSKEYMDDFLKRKAEQRNSE